MGQHFHPAAASESEVQSNDHHMPAYPGVELRPTASDFVPKSTVSDSGSDRIASLRPCAEPTSVTSLAQGMSAGAQENHDSNPYRPSASFRATGGSTTGSLRLGDGLVPVSEKHLGLSGFPSRSRFGSGRSSSAASYGYERGPSPRPTAHREPTSSNAPDESAHRPGQPSPDALLVGLGHLGLTEHDQQEGRHQTITDETDGQRDVDERDGNDSDGDASGGNEGDEGGIQLWEGGIQLWSTDSIARGPRSEREPM